VHTVHGLDDAVPADLDDVRIGHGRES
jgi:hypothetical protein